MTCIVGIEHEGSVWLGGDSIAIEDYSACSITDPKVFVLENALAFGFCGSLRAGQLVKYALQLPKRAGGQDDMKYLVVDFVDSLRAVWQQKGVMRSDSEGIELKGLIGYNGNLYYIDEDLQIGRVDRGYFAVGVGQDIALGALYALKTAQVSPEQKLNIALEGAVTWCAGVRPPFTIVHVGGIEQSVPQRKRHRST